MKTFPLFILLITLVSYKNNANEVVPIQADKIQFWNHAVTNPEKYEGLLKSAEKYDPIIGTDKDSTQIQITLIKKISNWHQQHSNGLKIHFNSADLTFGDLEAMFVSVSLDNDASLVLSKEKLFQRYSEGITSGLIQKNWFDELISEYGIVNIKLFGEHHENQDIETVFANYQLRINSTMIKQYQNTEIPIVLFDLYRQKNWQEQSVSLDEIKTAKVLGMLITAETNNEKTLRSYMQDMYSKRVPENYIELALSMKGIALITKAKNMQ
jgi:hypothetical protein